MSSEGIIAYWDCVDLVYASANTVVLEGDYLILNASLPGNVANPFLWQAVDSLKANGYVIDSVVIGGTCSQATPNVYHVVVMSKP